MGLNRGPIDATKIDSVDFGRTEMSPPYSGALRMKTPDSNLEATVLTGYKSQLHHDYCRILKPFANASIILCQFCNHV